MERSKLSGMNVDIERMFSEDRDCGCAGNKCYAESKHGVVEGFDNGSIYSPFQPLDGIKETGRELNDKYHDLIDKHLTSSENSLENIGNDLLSDLQSGYEDIAQPVREAADTIRTDYQELINKVNRNNTISNVLIVIVVIILIYIIYRHYSKK